MNGVDVYLPQPHHGLCFRSPVTVWDEALPLGNGILGGLVWGDGNPLVISLDRTDLWDLRPVPEFHSEEYSYRLMCRWHEEGRHDELVRLYEEPYRRPAAPTKIPAGRIEITLGHRAHFSHTALTLTDALAEMHFVEGMGVRAFIHAVQPVGMIHIQNAASLLPKLVAPPFAGEGPAPTQGMDAGDLSHLGYPAPERSSGQNWQAFIQRGAEGFRFAVYLGWREGAGAWLAAWSIASSFEGHEPQRIAKQRVEQALDAGFEGMFASHGRWWKEYWQKSSIQVPNDLIQRQWFLDRYKFGAASRRGSPPITLQGPWTADDGKLPPWKGDYHHDLNTQLSYWPCYSGNHLEEGLSFLDWLWETRDACFAWTRRFFAMPGLNVPMTADLNNNQMGGWRQYTHSATTAAWLAHHFYLHWKYSADPVFLQERTYPYLRDASVFIEAVTAKRGPDGRRTLPLSASPEINNNRPDAWFKTMTNFDLALIRWLLGATAELAAELKLFDEADRWRRVVSEMPELSFGAQGQLLVAPGYPLRESHRHFSHLMAIHPLGLIDWSDGEAAQKTITSSLLELERLGTSQWTGYSFAWLSNLAARAGDGDRAEKALEIFARAFTLRNSFHCNGDQSGQGYSRFTYRPFTLEGNFAAAAGLQEMLLQSHRGKIVVFPAVPDGWRDITFTDLRAQGAFLISAQRIGGETTQVEILAERGGRCTLVSPFSGRDIPLHLKSGERILLTEDPAL